MFLTEAEKFRKFAIKEENSESKGTLVSEPSFLIANLQEMEKEPLDSTKDEFQKKNSS